MAINAIGKKCKAGKNRRVFLRRMECGDYVMKFRKMSDGSDPRDCFVIEQREGTQTVGLRVSPEAMAALVNLYIHLLPEEI